MIFVFLFGLSVAFFLFLLTVVRRSKNNADYVLTSWMGYMTIHLTLFVIDYSQFTYQHPHLLGIILPFPILHGAFLYFYTIQTTTNRRFSMGVVLLHLLPFLTLVALALPFYSLPAAEKLQVYLDQGRGYEWYSTIQMVMFTTFGMAYSVVSILQIRKYRRQLQHTFSNHDKKKLVWLECMSYGLGCIWLLAFFGDQVVFSGVVLFVLFIGIFGINQTQVFLTPASGERIIDPSEVASTPDEVSEKYQKSGLSEEEARRLHDSLEAYMRINKPYKNADLTLDELASLLQVNPNQLSQIINSRIGKTFYHYINGYRIREFLALSASPDSNRFTYMGLAYDCGFQSKTTFNKYFKIETGKTPSEYFQVTRVA